MPSKNRVKVKANLSPEDIQAKIERRKAIQAALRKTLQEVLQGRG